MEFCKESVFNDLLYTLRRNYPQHASTFGPCKKCSNSARGGWLCADCVEADIAGLVGDQLAHELHKAIKLEHKLIGDCMDVIIKDDNK